MVRRRRVTPGASLVRRLAGGLLAGPPALRRGQWRARTICRGPLAALYAGAPVQPATRWRNAALLPLRRFRFLLARSELRVAVRSFRGVLLLKDGQLVPWLRRMTFELPEPCGSNSDRSELSRWCERRRRVSGSAKTNKLDFG